MILWLTGLSSFRRDVAEEVAQWLDAVLLTYHDLTDLVDEPTIENIARLAVICARCPRHVVVVCDMMLPGEERERLRDTIRSIVEQSGAVLRMEHLPPIRGDAGVVIAELLSRVSGDLPNPGAGI